MEHADTTRYPEHLVRTAWRGIADSRRWIGYPELAGNGWLAALARLNEPGRR